MEAIDVQQFHVLSDEWVNQGDWLEAIQKLKDQGKVNCFGVSINDFQPGNAIKLIESGGPEDQLFPACERHQVGAIIRGGIG